MREFVLFVAHSNEQLGLWAALRRLIANHKTRKDLRLLSAMDDYQIRDIGLTREELNRLLGHPDNVDLRHEAERLRRVKR
jgi:uncharacterized protein YjiS (DUF1127 family)